MKRKDIVEWLMIFAFSAATFYALGRLKQPFWPRTYVAIAVGSLLAVVASYAYAYVRRKNAMEPVAREVSIITLVEECRAAGDEQLAKDLEEYSNTRGAKHLRLNVAGSDVFAMARDREVRLRIIREALQRLRTDC